MSVTFDGIANDGDVKSSHDNVRGDVEYAINLPEASLVPAN